MSSLTKPAIDLLSMYAAYHRDRRNIATHFVGIPMIVFAIAVLLARVQVEFGAVMLNAAWVVWGLAAVWYLTRGNLVLGGTTALVNGLLTAAAVPLAAGSTAQWLGWGLGVFVAGWVLQFIGHHYEGRKPAFVDDLVGLLVGPMFVVGEALFALGWGRALLAEIEQRVGPTHVRDLARPAT
jgi:uncharacterized membrane protein YGL010W